MDAVGIVSTKIEESLAFYKNFELNFTSFGEGHYEAVLESGVRLMIDCDSLIRKLDPSWTPTENRSIILCFKKETPEEVDKLYELLLSKKYRSKTAPWDAFWGQRYSSILDPDGNQIDIFAELTTKKE